MLEDYFKYNFENKMSTNTEEVPLYVKRIVEELQSDIVKQDISLVYTDRASLLRICIDMGKGGIESIELRKLIDTGP
jgi:hypothetical protein